MAPGECTLIVEPSRKSKRKIAAWTTWRRSWLVLVYFLWLIWEGLTTRSRARRWVTALKKLLVTGWMKEVPGVQCLWNKYAEDGLQNGGFSFVKEFMDGLLSGSCEIHFHFWHNRWRESCFTTISFSLRSLCFLFQFFFCLLKFSLLLHNEKVEARLAGGS